MLPLKYDFLFKYIVLLFRIYLPRPLSLRVHGQSDTLRKALLLLFYAHLSYSLDLLGHGALILDPLPGLRAHDQATRGIVQLVVNFGTIHIELTQMVEGEAICVGLGVSDHTHVFDLYQGTDHTQVQESVIWVPKEVGTIENLRTQVDYAYGN